MMASSSNMDDATAVTQETELTEMQSPLERAEAGASLPTPDEIRTTVNPRPATSGRRQGWAMLLIFSICVVLVIVLSVGIALGVGQKKDNNADSSSFSPPEEVRKSTSVGIKNFMVSTGVSSLETFEDPDSPQSRAARWMAEDDGMNTPIPDDEDEDESAYAFQFIFRYAMTVLYYSTGGENWRYDFNFLSAKPTCSWNGQLQVVGTSTFLDYGLLCSFNQPAAIYLDNMWLTGEIPSELKVLSSLQVLDLNFNDDLGGPFPEFICEWTGLKRFALGFNKVNGTIPSCINNLDQMQVLFLANSRLSGRIPPMDKMVKLELLYLDDNSLSGDITTHFDTLTNLRFLMLEDNNFTGLIDSNFLSQNTKLEVLDISDNDIAGIMPEVLFGFEALGVVDMSGNELTGQMAEFPVSKIKFLALQNNQISGPISASISNLYNLRHLDLSNNTLSVMSEELGLLTNLTYLFLGDNPFSPGPIPDSFSNLTAMGEFSAKNTARNGSLPTFISTWKALKFLDLDGNQFEGELPSEYGELGSLEFLLLNDNNLTGLVPPSFASLIKLRAAFLEDNQFVGNLTHMCNNGAFTEAPLDLDGDELLVADCGGGAIECDCCVCCSPTAVGGGEDKLCNDHELIASLNPTWESGYQRIEYNFGNYTRFVDRSFLG